LMKSVLFGVGVDTIFYYDKLWQISPRKERATEHSAQ